MSLRSVAWPALGLAWLLTAAPASAVTLSVIWEVEEEVGYSLRLLVTQDGGPDATFDSCADGVCMWDVDVTFSELGGGVLEWSGSATHEDADTFFFSGTNGTIFQGQVDHGDGTDFYGGGHTEDLGMLEGEFVLSGRHIPEPAAALLVATALLGVGRRLRARPSVAAAALLSGALAASPVALAASPVDPTGTSEPPVVGAVQGAGCQPFLDTSGPFGTEWPLYHNGTADLALSWTLPNATVGEWVTLWLDGQTTGGDEQVPSADEFAFINVLISDFDDEPPGYALSPGVHTLWAQMEQNGVLCTQGAQFTAWPPLIDVTAENAPFDESPTRTETITFHQMFKVDVPVTDYYALHAGLTSFTLAGIPFSFGSTATAGQDFDGPVTTYPDLNPITFPAGEQTATIDIRILDDRCPELTEQISIHAIYEIQLEWAHIIWMAPEWTFDILDDDEGLPCRYTPQHELTPHP